MIDAPHHPHRPNFYAAGSLDRADALRGDATWLARALKSPDARFLPLWRGLTLIATDGDAAVRAVHLSPLPGGMEAATEIVFLGLDRDRHPCFAADLSHHEEPPGITADGSARFADLRRFAPALPGEDAALLAYARGILQWHARHGFCSACGAPSHSAKGGHERRCSAAACGVAHFPRLDPAVIMLVHDGAGRIVLGRQTSWPAGRHSVLAGFVEPGESLEDAVAREVMEEVGLAVSDVRYHSSQPWPFPAAVMLGFSARAAYEPLQVNRQEIETADWFTRDALLALEENDEVTGGEGDIRLPSRDSIARRLITDWLRAGG